MSDLPYPDVRMAEDENDDPRDPSVGLATRTRTRTKKPTPYRVLMLNDDYTPMEFVVLCLQRFFRMNMEEATRVMLHVHQRGVGVCGGDQGEPGDRFRPAEPAPAPMHARKGVSR
jgi:ATP-dependent Clp protease adaptor protein ClpS